MDLNHRGLDCFEAHCALLGTKRFEKNLFSTNSSMKEFVANLLHLVVTTKVELIARSGLLDTYIYNAKMQITSALTQI